MKKLLYSLSVVLLIAGMTTMTSCKKTEKKILGKWKVTSCTIDGETEDSFSETWTFKENGKFIGMDFVCDAFEEAEGCTYSCEYSCDDKTLTLTVTGNGEYYVDRWNRGFNDYYSKVKYVYTLDLDIDELNNKTMSLSGNGKIQEKSESYYRDNPNEEFVFEETGNYSDSWSRWSFALEKIK